MRLRKVLTLTAMFCLGTGAAFAEEIEITKVPKAVLQTVVTRYRKGKIEGAEKETDKDKTVTYDITVTNNGRKMVVTLTPNGKIEDILREIKAEDLPKPVKTALEKKYPKAEFKSLHESYDAEEAKDVLESYEIELLTTDKKHLDVNVSPQGEITSEEAAE